LSAPKQVVATKDTVTAKMARWAAGLEYRHLSPDAVCQAKRFLLDSVGCALGGYQQHDVSRIRPTLRIFFPPPWPAVNAPRGMARN